LLTYNRGEKVGKRVTGHRFFAMASSGLKKKGEMGNVGKGKEPGRRRNSGVHRLNLHYAKTNDLKTNEGRRGEPNASRVEAS